MVADEATNPASALGPISSCLDNVGFQKIFIGSREIGSTNCYNMCTHDVFFYLPLVKKLKVSYPAFRGNILIYSFTKTK